MGGGGGGLVPPRYAPTTAGAFCVYSAPFSNAGINTKLAAVPPPAWVCGSNPPLSQIQRVVCLHKMTSLHVYSPVSRTLGPVCRAAPIFPAAPCRAPPWPARPKGAPKGGDLLPELTLGALVWVGARAWPVPGVYTGIWVFGTVCGGCGGAMLPK